MSAIQLDHKRFHRRIRYLASKWKNNTEAFQNVDAIALIVGDDDYENPYRKSITLQVSRDLKRGCELERTREG
ncbi:hypothetical protein G6F61_003829 [Rhizopus arrhizus]|nr:hypothetical protein G6F61_003829 [Rhizopus arrhizus]